MSVLQRGVIKSYSGGSHKAAVQVAGSLAVWLESLPVATDIAAAEVIAGRECAVLFFDESNPEDAVIVCIYGAVPGSPAAGAKIQDADGNTSVDTEKNANEDKVRVTIAGVERVLVQVASPQLTVTGDLLVGLEGSSYHRVAIGSGIQADAWLGISGLNAVNLGSAGIKVAYGLATAPPVTDIWGIGGLVNLPSGKGTAGAIYGLNFKAYFSGLATDSVSNLVAMALQTFSVASGNTITNARGVWVLRPGVFNASKWRPQNQYQVYVEDPYSAVGSGTPALCVSLKLDDISGGNNRYLIEAGPATPNLRLEGNAPAASGDSRLLLAIHDGAAVVLRRVLVDGPNTAGAGFRNVRVLN